MSAVSWMSFLLAWVGALLILDRIPWFRASDLTSRLRPTSRPGSPERRRAGHTFSVASVLAVLGPLATWIGARVSGSMGMHDDTARRLERIGSPLDLTAFRVRQFAWATAGGVLALAGATALSVGPVITVGLSLGAPALAYLIIENQLASRSAAWQERLTMELPIVAEQLGMMLSSGASLSGAIARIASRGDGIIADGFAGVTRRIGQGVGEIESLREWAALADVGALDRFVGVLALNREASDLGGLISSEARAVRSHVHRSLLEVIERRGQQVWIPVTVATLLPGVLFMVVPFIDAMNQLTGS